MLGYSDNIMMVELTFKKGAQTAPHNHLDHSQGIYVLRGKFELTCENTMRVCTAGDCCYAPPGEMHGSLALEDDSVILDIHHPMRADILAEGKRTE